MKRNIIGIIGLIFLVLGIGLIALRIWEGEKTIIASIAGGFTQIFAGIILIVQSRRTNV